ncbi:MAG TPA: GIY-YIG nuclease family protein [Acidobacteriaceae bacterium]|nr:GIY-YIG nuclease family protein [Acidobacteriaceae bacterium]
MREHCCYVYILASTFKRLYTGVTNDLMVRTGQHKAGKNPDAFTAKCRIQKLVYYERFQYINDAIRREKEIKGWLRERKIALVVNGYASE